MLADWPHLVHRDKMVKPTLKRDSVPEFTWRTDDLSETGAFGDPSLSTKELGEKLWEAWGESVARFLLSISEECGAGRKG